VTKRSLWRLTVTLLICGACAYFFIPLSQVRLGLDLKGGVHFELEVQGNEALEADLRDTRDRLQDRLKEKGFPDAVLKLDGSVLRAEGVPADQRPAAEKVLQSFFGYDATFTPTGFTLTQKAAYQKSLKDDANKRALQIIENRINQFGVAEPEITASGAEGNRIVVELPGVGDAERERIKGLLTTPGRLEQRLVAKPDVTQGRGFPTRMSGVLPEFDPNTRALKVRLEVANADYALRPDMFVDVEFKVKVRSAMLAPVEAVLDTGTRKVVFVDRGNGFFEPRKVETGARLGDSVIVASGLTPGEKIVVSGNFLIDSESRLQLAATPAGARDPVCGMPVDTSKPALHQATHNGTTYTFCSESCKGKFVADPAKYAMKDE